MARKRKLTKGILENGILQELPSETFQQAVCPIRKAYVEEIDERIKHRLANEFGLSFNQSGNAGNNAKLGDVWTTKF
jgi:hypothetical protein